MSRGFIKEGDQEDIPMVPPRAHLPKGIPNYVTHEGLEALNNERKDLENQRAEANGNYIICNFIDAKLKLLIDRINSAVEVDLSKASKDVVSFGAWVRYNDRTIRIVGVDEADFAKGLLSFLSPIAKALIGKKTGDTFEVVVPKGKETVTIQQISFEPLELTCVESVNSGKDIAVKHSLSNVNTRPTSAVPVEKIEEKCEEAKTIEVEPDKPEAKAVDVFSPEENIMEFLPVVNERGNIVGRDLFMNLHKGNKILHPVVHLHVMDPSGEKKMFWWHVSLGETPEKTLVRKICEILKISGVKPKFKRQYIRETKLEKELVYVFVLNTDAQVMPTPAGKEYLDVFAKD